MCNRNRRVGREMRIALTGEEDGVTMETAAQPVQPVRAVVQSSSDEDSADSDEDDDVEEGNRIANKKYPLAHRCMSMDDFRSTDILESLLDRPREVTTVCQDTLDGFGEGIDLGLSG